MTSSYRLYASPSVRTLLLVLTILFSLCITPAGAASEPGTITIVLPSEPDSLDPGNTARNIVGQVVLKNIVETLTEINPADSSIIPRLASSWKQIDTTTWHFFLRKGVKFHDGADFNSQAVIFSINRLYDKRVDSRNRTQFFSGFKMEGKALDSYTLEIKTDKFQPLMPNFMGVMTICSPNTPVDKLTRSPIGTGPYKLARWDQGTQIVLEAFDGYWGKQPQVKKAIYVWRTESAVRASMVLIGEADLAPDIARQDAKLPDMDQSYLNSETTSLRIGGVWEPPLNDRRVRMALNYAFDRNAIQGSIFSKDVIPATQMIAPNIFGHNPDLKPWPYDPQKARQLLDEARKDGVPVDKEILLVGRIGNFPGGDELMEVAMTQYKAVGLNVKLKMVEVATYVTYNAKPYPQGLYILQKSHDNSKGDAVFTASQYQCAGASSVMCDRMVDDLIAKAQVATGEERRSLWRAMFKRAHEEVIPYVMLYHMVGYVRVGKRINFKPSIATNGEIQVAQITFK
jgi:peptide/nickel transport system substrate-binding protein